jgi:hypothetical protein
MSLFSNELTVPRSTVYASVCILIGGHDGEKKTHLNKYSGNFAVLVLTVVWTRPVKIGVCINLLL